MDGQLTGGVRVPFLRDPEVQIRFLLALPLLIAAEVYVHERMRTMAPQFLSRGLIAAEDQPRFQEAVASTLRLSHSVIAELILLILVVTIGFWFWRRNFALSVSSWYAVGQGAGLRLTAAGWYYAFVSLSIFRFILYRWYFRLLLWYRFLWRVKGMPLHLNLFHPDRAGGLGFLSGGALAFGPVFLAQTILMAGVILDHILYQGARLPNFKMDILGILVFCVLVLVLPLGFFIVKLEDADRKAKREFGILSSHYVDDFHSKWIDGTARPEEPLLGTSDIQSLADLANSFAVVSRMRLVPISKESLFRLVLMIALPFLPLTLTMFSLDEVIRRLMKFAF
jgi:hypothetical protein